MRIAYLSPLASPDEHAVSGVPKVSETLLGEFEKLPGLCVEVITLVDGLAREVKRERGSVRYHYLPCRAKGKTATLYWLEKRRLKRLIRELQVDFVHGQPSAEYLLAATGCGLPHVITIHGLVMREAAGTSLLHSGRVANWVREQLQRRAIRRANHIISISPYVVDYLDGWAHGRIWPVANPIDAEFFEIAPPDHAGLRILCVGIVSERKNQALLVQACRLLHTRGLRFECHFVGPFSPGADERMGGLIREYGLSNRVLLKGKISRADMSAEYAWSNVVVLPSREETSPLSLIQAMACGRCIFGANAAGIPGLLRQGAFGTLFPADSASLLAEQLARFGSESAPFWKKARLAQDFARSTFMPDAVARRTLQVYGQILSAG